jgi:hypothetical protein
VNFEPHFLLASAELARVRGEAGAVAAYERAWTSARARGAPMREAIALERGAEAAAAQGDSGMASQLLTAGISSYRRWGAATKAEALERHPADSE